MTTEHSLPIPPVQSPLLTKSYKFSFPSLYKPDPNLKPNPYAVKTTTSVLLTHSNSSSHASTPRDTTTYRCPRTRAGARRARRGIRCPNHSMPLQSPQVGRPARCPHLPLHLETHLPCTVPTLCSRAAPSGRTPCQRSRLSNHHLASSCLLFPTIHPRT